MSVCNITLMLLSISPACPIFWLLFSKSLSFQAVPVPKGATYIFFFCSKPLVSQKYTRRIQCLQKISCHSIRYHLICTDICMLSQYSLDLRFLLQEAPFAWRSVGIEVDIVKFFFFPSTPNQFTAQQVTTGASHHRHI